MSRQPFGLALVPLVYISTAMSRTRTRGLRWSILASDSGKPSRSTLTIATSGTIARYSSLVTSTFTSAWVITWPSSWVLKRALTGTTTAPSLAAPNSASTNSRRLPSRMPTLLPARMPSECRERAVASVRSASSP